MIVGNFLHSMTLFKWLMKRNFLKCLLH